MTRQELVEKLMQYPPDTEVYIPDWADGCLTAAPVRENEITEATWLDFQRQQIRGLIIGAR